MFLFKAGGRYYLCCAEQIDGRYSCMVATSTNLCGPYSARYEAIPHGGHNTFFRDASGSGGRRSSARRIRNGRQCCRYISTPRAGWTAAGYVRDTISRPLGASSR